MSFEVMTEALAGYRIDGELGRGAMGEVYGGRHLGLQREVAIKRLPPGFAADPEVRSRFGAEAQVLASLDHPHVVPVYDYVEREDLCMLVMQALGGGTVWQWFCDAGVSETTACAVAIATCAGLSHAHERRVLHRDVKPENLMFDEHHQLKVTDFGIATVLGGEGTLATADGEVIGTPAYMAPEQADGSAVGPPADVYAVATMLYELLSGRLPFSEEGEPMDLLRRRLSEEPVPLSRVAPRVPGSLAEVVMSGLEVDPASRPDTAESFGVEVARAAVGSWGPGWLDTSEVKLLAGGVLAGAATTVVAPTTASSGPSRAHPDDRLTPTGTGVDARPTAAPGEAVTRARSDETIAPSSEASRAATSPSEPTEPPPGPAPAPTPRPPEPRPPEAEPARRIPPQEVVRPTVTAARRGGADLSGLSPDDVIPVTAAVGPPRLPWLAIVVSVLFAALTVAAGAGVVGSDGSTADTDVASGQLLIAGVDPAVEPSPTIDLGAPISLVLTEPPEGAATVQMRFSVGGVPIGSSNEVPLAPSGAGMAAMVSAASPRVLASGPVDAQILVRDARGTELASPTIQITPDRAVWLSVGGWLAILATLMCAGYASSLIAPLRRGRRRVRSTVGMAIVGSVAGATVVLWAWALGGPQPAVDTLVVAAVSGAVSLGAAALAIHALGRRRRLRRRLRARARARADAGVGASR